MDTNLWTEEEERILREYYPSESLQKIAEMLPHRSIAAIRRKAVKMRVYKYNVRAWSDSELDILIKNYSKMKVKHIMELLPGRSATNIYNKAQQLCLSAYNNKSVDCKIKQSFGTMPLYRLANALGINYSTVRYRAAKIGLL